ncbi:MAG TPA: hypothetical protein VHL34_15675, partial [Rhizomicrobium sp.]|nr:hypothetical protein [Rhizomicrobium sp.]
LAAKLPNLGAKEREALMQISGGSLGMALQLSSGDGLELARDAAKIIDSAGVPDVPAIVALAERINRMTDGLDRFGGFLSQALMDRIRTKARAGAPGLDRWVAAWEAASETVTRSSGLNLEPKQTFLNVAGTLALAAKRAGSL